MTFVGETKLYNCYWRQSRKKLHLRRDIVSIFEQKESKTTVLLSRRKDATSKDPETKLTQLQITREKTDAVLASWNENRIKRHQDALCSVVASVEKAKRKLEELKFAAGEELSTITSCGAKLDQDIAAVDLDMDGISSFLNNFDQEQIEKARNDQLAFKKELFEKKLQYTKELKSANFSDQAGSQNGKQSAALAKLSKLTITKFNGTSLDWNRFWNHLCKLDVLGLADTPQHDQGEVYREFHEQLSRSEKGWYEAALPWKGNHLPLPSNEYGSLRRLESLKQKLKRTGLEQYGGPLTP